MRFNVVFGTLANSRELSPLPPAPTAARTGPVTPVTVRYPSGGLSFHL